MSENMNSHDYSASNQDLLLGIDCAQKILDNYKNNSELQTWLNNFISQRFTNNIKALKNYFPNLAEKIENYRPTRPFDFFCDENGVTNLIFLDNNDILYKCSNPILFCQKQAENVINSQKVGYRPYLPEKDLYGQISYKYINAMADATQKFRYQSSNLALQKSSPIFMFLGVGLGYQIAEVCEKIEILNIIIVEPNFDLFVASLFVFDWQNLLTYAHSNNLRIKFILGEDTAHSEIYIKHFIYHHGKFLAGSLQLLTHYKNEAIEKIQNNLYKNYSRIKGAIGYFDDLIFGIAHGCYTFFNRKNFVVNTPLQGQYKDVPVFVIGSGPSLDNDIRFIRKNQDKAIIIACGTAIDTLYHAGIKPDFFACTERTPELSQLIREIPDQTFFDDIILLCSHVNHPYITQYFKKTAIFAKNNETLIHCLARICKELAEIKSIDYINPLVGNMGTSGAISLGFNNIFLFGLDNGKKEDAIHSKFTTLYKNRGYSEDVVEYQTDSLVKGNFGGLCKTNGEYLYSVEIIGISIKIAKENNKELKCYNCSDGVLIMNTIPIHSNELSTSFDLLKLIDKKRFLENFSKYETKVFDLDRNQLEMIISSQQYNIVANNIIKKLQKNITSRVQVIHTLLDISEYLAKLQEEPTTQICSESLNSSLQKMFTMVISTLYSKPNEHESINDTSILLHIIIEFIEESKLVFSKLPDYILWDHLKHYKNGKLGKDFLNYRAPNLPTTMDIIKIKYDDPNKKFRKLYE